MTKQFKIDGMVCEGCASSVKELIDAMPAVNSVSVNLQDNSAEVYSDEEISADQIQKVFVENNKTYKVADYK